MDPYDLPQEFSHLQAQDMSKLGFMQDLIRGINKIAEPERPGSAREHQAAAAQASNPLLERAFIFIEDGDFQSGDEYCEKVLDEDPKCAEAYLGKLMVDLKVKKRRQLASVTTPFEQNVNYKRLVRFGSAELIEEVNEYLEEVNTARSAKEKAHSQEAQHLQAQRKESQDSAREKNEALQRAEQEKRLEEQKKRLAEITEQYKRIPSEKQIKETVKKEKSVKALKTAAIIFLFIYWPISLALFIVRHVKIKKAMEEENAKYNRIRAEYARLKTPARSGATFQLFVIKENQVFAYNPDVTMKIGANTYTITHTSPLSLPLPAGYYAIDFKASFRSRHVDLNLTKNTTIVLSWNRMTGALEAKVQ
jgi:hypothetical protein